MKCCCRMTPRMKIRLFCGIILLLATLSQDKLPYYPYCAEVLLLLFQFKVSCLSFFKKLKCHFLTIFGWVVGSNSQYYFCVGNNFYFIYIF